jgi:hypothetical protein
LVAAVLAQLVLDLVVQIVFLVQLHLLVAAWLVALMLQTAQVVVLAVVVAVEMRLNHQLADQVHLVKVKAVVLDFHLLPQIGQAAVVAVLMPAAVAEVQLLLVMAATA